MPSVSRALLDAGVSDPTQAAVTAGSGPGSRGLTGSSPPAQALMAVPLDEPCKARGLGRSQGSWCRVQGTELGALGTHARHPHRSRCWHPTMKRGQI